MAKHRQTSGETTGGRLASRDYRFDAAAGQLWRGETEIRLTPRASALLAVLAERPGELVSKHQLIDRLWNGKAVGDDALTSCVQDLRRALGDDPRQPRFVETRHRRGYRLLLPMASAAVESPATTEKASIAVLPFHNAGGEAEQAYFADGMAEDILGALSRFPGLLVVARQSAFAYRGRAVDVRQVGRDLGVRYVLQGSVRAADGHVRIAARLIQADTGAHLWADRYEGDLGDVFALQDRITETVVGVVAPSIQQAEIERTRRQPPGSLDAYDLFLRALSLYVRMTREDNDEACTLLKRAIELDPEYAAALGLLNMMLDCRVAQGWSTADEIAPDSRKYMQLARQIAPHDPDVLALQARAAAYLDGRHDEAITLIERSLVVNPNSAMTRTIAGWIYVYAGQPERAIAHVQVAQRLNPDDRADFHSWIALAHALLQLARDGEALDAARRAVRRAPTFVASWRILAAILGLAGRIDEAQAAMVTVLRLAPAMSLSRMSAMPTWTAAARARYFEGLRLAGMPA